MPSARAVHCWSRGCHFDQCFSSHELTYDHGFYCRHGQFLNIVNESSLLTGMSESMMGCQRSSVEWSAHFSKVDESEERTAFEKRKLSTDRRRQIRAGAEILHFFDTNEHPTVNQPFQQIPHGSLTPAPSFRCFSSVSPILNVRCLVGWWFWVGPREASFAWLL
jgi:hypothetical protein